jgi:FkbM family methyltransferase
MKDFSQNGEQQAILAAFVGKVDGRFLDIGSYLPLDNSNTRAFYELGWSGVMVEPSPGPMTHLLREYGHDPRILLIQAAVGLAPRLAKMHVTDDALSTVDEAHHARCTAAGYEFYGSLLVPQMPLERLFMEVGNAFDFVSIDVEGGSADLILRYLDLVREHPEHGYNQAAPPKCFCVEHDHRQKEIEFQAGQRGYRVALRNGENLVLVKE